MDRFALSKAITLIESTKKEDRLTSSSLLSQLLLERTASQPVRKTYRIGITGPPGAGKSTFIDSFGSHLIKQHNHKVAVLAIDPSSERTGGAILGDKTRMNRLCMNANSFIRPTATHGSLGGVAKSTHDSIILCEAAGFDIIIVETVGVGQSETIVSEIVDLFALIVPPASGDELQGIKKGIVELADMILVNKVDGPLKQAGHLAIADYTSATKLIHAGKASWKPPVLGVSSVENVNLDNAWAKMLEYFQFSEKSGLFETKRSLQKKKWLMRHVEAELLQRFRENVPIQSLANQLSNDIATGNQTLSTALSEMFKLIPEAINSAKC